jgi:dTMP kinase
MVELKDKNYPGVFITLEGIEGVGKTTNMRFLAEYLHQHEVPVLVTREPGGTPLADDIRHFLLSEHDEQVQPETELLLIFAARAQHIRNVIWPALEAGKLVICDRFTDTSYAYQGAGRGIEKEKIQMLEKVVQDDLKPDVTILLDAPIEVGLDRIQNRPKTDRFESETKNFFTKCRKAYLAMAKAEQDRFVVVDATQPMEQLRKQLLEILAPAIKKVCSNNQAAV